MTFPLVLTFHPWTTKTLQTCSILPMGLALGMAFLALQPAANVDDVIMRPTQQSRAFFIDQPWCEGHRIAFVFTGF